MFQVAGLVLPLFGLILLGYVAGRLRKIPLEGLAWLNFFILYIALPALFFQLLATTPVAEFANGRYLLTTTLGTFIIFVSCFVIARTVRRTDTRTATVQGFAGAYGNIGYMGPPLAIAAFGPQAGVPVALVFCLDNAMHFTLAPTLMALGNGRQQLRASTLFIGILRSILTHPFILATLAGITAAVFTYRPPAPIEQLLASAANAAAPCALFAMGVTAALRPLRRVPVELSYLIPVKLIVHPLLMYVLLSQIPDLDRTWLHAAVLLAALPSATNVFVIAQQYHVWEERASSAVVLSTLLSVVTVTTYLYLVRTGMI
ncbi:MAG: AEC family transporter [Granulosicoccus sp.]|nr:AEC family transporter [Granulosicoccus sp.]